MIDSNAPFARKFHRNDPVLDKIDAELLFCPPGMLLRQHPSEALCVLPNPVREARAFSRKNQIDVSQAIVCVIAFQIANFGESMIGAALQDKEGFQWVIKKMINEGHSTNKQAIVTSNRLYDDEEEPSIEEYYDDEESSYEVNKKNEEERHIRDRRAFLLHSLFVDVAIFRAIASIQYVMEKRIASSIEKDEILHFEIVGDFNITVTRDTSDASCKLDTKIDGNRKTGMDRKHLIERNLLKGITAAEKTTTHRMFLHAKPIKEQIRAANHAMSSKHEELTVGQAFVEKLLNDSLARLDEEKTDENVFMRWELGACWIQHLQDQKNAEKEKKPVADKDKKHNSEKTKGETKVEGLGMPLKFLKNTKKLDG
ncbi:uncharacterized protein A4U43_C01F25660 [Asparagus officinalis]|uniref:Uncharacterized protein n=1 Tax=Asparagus officinalis TaxID=4686 RepID=A0A5P1FSZ4_ASPOF|nr:uncharacterized protein A4U43_C01F25660 [Asparagus officinalis]